MLKGVMDFLTLQKPEFRLGFFGLVTMVLLVTPYQFLEQHHLSLYERLHIPSPSIGLTRAYWKLIHGDFSGAWQRNKLIYAVVCIVLGIVVKDILELISKRPSEL